MVTNVFANGVEVVINPAHIAHMMYSPAADVLTVYMSSGQELRMESAQATYRELCRVISDA